MKYKKQMNKSWETETSNILQKINDETEKLLKSLDMITAFDGLKLTF